MSDLTTLKARYDEWYAFLAPGDPAYEEVSPYVDALITELASARAEVARQAAVVMAHCEDHGLDCRCVYCDLAKELDGGKVI